MKPPVHLIGVPLDLGGNRRGVDMGPSAFRIAGLGDQIAALGYTVVDKGDLPAPIPETKGHGDVRKKYVREIAKVCQRLYQVSLASLEDGALPIVLGGDHSLAAGSVAATANHVRRTHDKPVGLIWVDAHGDMNTPQTSGSGNVHGMPPAAPLGHDQILREPLGDNPSVRAEHVVLVGVRNLDDRERVAIRASHVHVFTMKDIDREGIAVVAEKAIARASEGTGGIHVSFDMDVCDPLYAPGVGTPVKGGLDYREAHLLMEMLADCGKMRAFDLVEVNPTLDLRNATAELGTELALSALGKNIF